MTLFKKALTMIITILTAMSCIFLTGCYKPGSSYINQNNADLQVKDYSKYIERLGDYKNVKYSLPSFYRLSPTELEQKIDETIQEEMKTTFSAETTSIERLTEPAEFKDTLIVTYHGTIDGEPFDGSDSSEDGEEIVLGFSGYNIAFDEGIKGMKKGETKEIEVPVTITKDGVTEKKTAKYEVTVNKIEYYTIPDITDEIVQKYTAYNNLDEYKYAMSNDLRNNYYSDTLAAETNAIMDTIVKNTKFKKLPEKEIEKLVEDSVALLSEEAEEYNMSIDEYLKTTQNKESLEEYKEFMHGKAEDYMKFRMVANQIALTEGIEITQDDIENYKNYLRASYDLDEHADTSSYESDEDIVFECIMTKIQPIIIENARCIVENDNNTDDDTNTPPPSNIPPAG